MYSKEEIKQRLEKGEVQIHFDDRNNVELLRELMRGYNGIEGISRYYRLTTEGYDIKTDFPFDLPIIKISDITEDEQNNIEVISEEVLNTPEHYDNSKGTLYKIAKERGWNPYLFDIVKRLERAEKKGEFKTDLEKSINVIKLWLKESETK